MPIVGMMPLCFEIPLPDLQVALTDFNHHILLVEMKSAEMKASGSCCLQPLGLLRVQSKRCRSHQGRSCGHQSHGGPRGPCSEGHVELQHLMEVTPSSHLCAHTHSTTTLEQRSTPRRKMQLQLFACCLSGLGLKVLKTYICVSLDVL